MWLVNTAIIDKRSWFYLREAEIQKIWNSQDERLVHVASKCDRCKPQFLSNTVFL